MMMIEAAEVLTNTGAKNVTNGTGKRGIVAVVRNIAKSTTVGIRRSTRTIVIEVEDEVVGLVRIHTLHIHHQLLHRRDRSILDQDLDRSNVVIVIVVTRRRNHTINTVLTDTENTAGAAVEVIIAVVMIMRLVL